MNVEITQNKIFEERKKEKSKSGFDLRSIPTLNVDYSNKSLKREREREKPGSEIPLLISKIKK